MSGRDHSLDDIKYFIDQRVQCSSRVHDEGNVNICGILAFYVWSCTNSSLMKSRIIDRYWYDEG